MGGAGKLAPFLKERKIKLVVQTIPKSSIVKAKVYYNVGCKKTMAQIQKELGCQYMVNTTLFDMNTKEPAGWLYSNGQKIKEVANPYGLAVKDSNIVFSYGNNVKYPDFTGCYHVLVRNGVKQITRSESDKYGYTDHTCVGIKKNGDIVIICDQTNRSLNGMADELIDAGCDVGLNFDGGGSTQCYYNGKTLYSSRNVIAFLCIWTKPVTETKPTEETQPSKEETNNVAKKKILLIAGHGAGDSGATSGSWQEATETRNVVAGLKEAMKNIADVTVYPTTRNAYTDYTNGVLNSQANFSQYNYVLEIHFNAFDGAASDGKTKGVECYVTTSESGVTVEEAICKNVAACGLTNRGVKRKNWSVINTAKKAGVSSALLEVCFIDDPDDMKVYSTKQSEIVKAIAEGVKSGFRLSGTIAEPYPKKEDDTVTDTKPTQPSKPSTSNHWAQANFDNLVARGVQLSDTRFDDNITRGEVFALADKILTALGK